MGTLIWRARKSAIQVATNAVIREAGLARVDLIAEADLSQRVLIDDDAVILAAPSRLGEAQAIQLRAYAENCGTVASIVTFDCCSASRISWRGRASSTTPPSRK